MNTRTYTIPADRQHMLDDWMARLAKIAKRIGVERPTYTVVAETRMVDPTIASDIVGLVYTIPAIEVEVRVPTLRLDGFEWVGVVKHYQDDAGVQHNLVVTQDDEVAVAYRHAASRCDRCGSKRNRTQTWLVRDADGNLLMVGGNCQKDLLGHSTFAPKTLLDWNDEMEGGWDTGAAYDSPAQYVIRAQAVIREHGYAKSIESNSTKGRVLRGDAKVTQDDADTALAAIDALTNLESRDTFESNLYHALLNGRKVRDNIGLLVYIPEWYRRHTQDEAVKEVVEETPVANVPVTTDRVKVVGVVTSLYSRDTDYGVQHKMVVKSDAGYTVCGTEPRSLYPEVGDRVEFYAALTPSANDSTFGFYNRPTQANVLD